MPEFKKRCASCTHWHDQTYEIRGSSIGYCTLNPPVPFFRNPGEQFPIDPDCWSQPATRHTDCCGQWSGPVHREVGE